MNVDTLLGGVAIQAAAVKIVIGFTIYGFAIYDLVDGGGSDDALETVLVVIASLGEGKVLGLRLVVVVEDDLRRLLGRGIVLLLAVPRPFPDLVAIGCCA
jgi:hypothetical protein